MPTDSKARWVVVAAIPLVMGCVISKDSLGDTEGDDAAEVETSAEGGTTTGGEESDTVSGGTDPGSGELDYVDCSEIFPGQPIVAPSPVSPLGFPYRPCNPRNAVDGEEYKCCSDDPAAMGADYPTYPGWEVDGGGEPIFAGANNGLSVFGFCVNTMELGSVGLADPTGCPIPCNPTWDETTIETVCGAGLSCCQTLELREEDCVLEDGVWRPARGGDVFDLEPPLTTWAPNSHVTHQDPNGNTCLQLAGGDLASAEFEECVRTLSVANQRGFCMSVPICPHEDPGYVDACEALNQ